MSTILKLCNLPDVSRSKSVTYKVEPSKLISDVRSPENIAGIELEIEYAGGYGCDMNFFGATEDRSLRNGGVEFVSKPLRVDVLITKLDEFFKTNAPLVVPDTYSDRTSTHVHMNVQDYTPENLKTLLLFYSLVETSLFKFVGNYRQENIYCVPLNETLILQNLSDTVTRILDGRTRAWYKYTALNLLPVIRYGTVEFRHMHGTNDIQKLKVWLSTLSNLITVSKNTALKDCVSSIRSLTKGENKLFNTLLPHFSYHEYGQLFEKSLTYAKYALCSELKSLSKILEEKVPEMPPPEVEGPPVMQWPEAGDVFAAFREARNLYDGEVRVDLANPPRVEPLDMNNAFGIQAAVERERAHRELQQWARNQALRNRAGDLRVMPDLIRDGRNLMQQVLDARAELDARANNQPNGF